MKIAVLIIRVLMGLLFLVSAVGYFFNLMPHPQMSGNAEAFMAGLFASGYVFTVVKSLEVLCAVALLSNRFVPLALVVIFPINVNILLFHVFMAPDGLLMSAFLLAGNLFLAYAYRRNYGPVFAARGEITSATR